MDKTSVVQLRLQKSKFKKIPRNERYSVLFLDKENYTQYLPELLNISTLMKQDFDWDGIPDETSLHRRFANNSHCLFWILDDSPIGWAWSNYNVSPNWETVIQELNDGEIYGGGAFLSRKIDRPADSGLIFYNMTFSYWLHEMNNEYIYQYSDDWNRVSAIMSYKNGFEKYNFLK